MDTNFEQRERRVMIPNPVPTPLDAKLTMKKNEVAGMLKFCESFSINNMGNEFLKRKVE
jgi:hypothetical protein